MKSHQVRGDYLPKITGTRVGTGYKLEDKSDTTQAYVFSLIAAIWVPGAGIAFANGLLDRDVFVTIFSGIFLLVGFAIAYGALSKIRVIRKLHNPTLLVEHWPLKLGQTCRMRFERKGKGGTAIERVGAKLILQEVARYRVGTETRTVTATIYERVIGAEAGTGVHTKCDFVLELPRDQAPSFHASHNHLDWKVEFHMIYAGGQDDATFDLLVVPEVAA